MVLGSSCECHLQPHRALLRQRRPGSADCHRSFVMLFWVRLRHPVYACLPRLGYRFRVEPVEAELFVEMIDPRPLESGLIKLERDQLNGAYSFFICLD